LISGGQLRPGTTISIDLTSLVNQALNANRVATFQLDVFAAPGSQQYVNFASREYAVAGYRPTLVVTSSSQTNQAPTVATPAGVTPSPVSGTTAALAVLGADDGGAANLTYTWTAATAPAGAPAPTFSINGNNAAKNTVVTFGKAGTYTFTARISDAGGLSVSSSVTVLVNQTFTSIRVSPASVTLATGAIQQFAALGLDQFGSALAVQPAFAWTTSAGTITTGGLLTAPATDTNLTVTAASGSLRSNASVSVTSSFLGLRDAALSALTRSLAADGTIDRQDMIRILGSTGSDDNVVDAVELGDLRTILSNAARLNIPGYVQVLAGDVVNGNSANAHYQGQTLGNLAAGSSAGILNNLINKWFYGTDHPADSGYTYRSAAGPLFVSGPAYTDMYQGQLGDCYLIASLGAIAKSSPAAIQNMFIDNGDGTWTVRYYYNGTADYVTVDRWLPSDSRGYLVYAGYGSYYNSTGNELWIPLAEKAYAQWNETGKEGRDGKNDYASIEGGWMYDVDAQALGRSAQTYWSFDTSTKQVLINALGSNEAVTIGTKSNPGNGLYGPHAYAVTGYNAASGTFTLYNPWGTDQPGPLTWSQLGANCQCFVVADPSGTVPFSVAAVPPASALITPLISGQIGPSAIAAAQGPVSTLATTPGADFAFATGTTRSAALAVEELATVRYGSFHAEADPVIDWLSPLGSDTPGTRLIRTPSRSRMSRVFSATAVDEVFQEDWLSAEHDLLRT